MCFYPPTRLIRPVAGARDADLWMTNLVNHTRTWMDVFACPELEELVRYLCRNPSCTKSQVTERLFVQSLPILVVELAHTFIVNAYGERPSGGRGRLHCVGD